MDSVEEDLQMKMSERICNLECQVLPKDKDGVS